MSSYESIWSYSYKPKKLNCWCSDIFRYDFYHSFVQNTQCQRRHLWRRDALHSPTRSPTLCNVPTQRGDTHNCRYLERGCKQRKVERWLRSPRWSLITHRYYYLLTYVLYVPLDVTSLVIMIVAGNSSCCLNYLSYPRSETSGCSHSLSYLMGISPSAAICVHSTLLPGWRGILCLLWWPLVCS